MEKKYIFLEFTSYSRLMCIDLIIFSQIKNMTKIKYAHDLGLDNLSQKLL